MKTINPWGIPKGYSNGILAEGKLLFIAGQIGWDKNEKIVSSDLVEQTRQALINIRRILEEAGGKAENLARLTWYVIDKNEYLSNQKDIGKVYREIFGKHYPAMSLLEVKSLLEDGAKVEIEGTAVL